MKEKLGNDLKEALAYGFCFLGGLTSFGISLLIWFQGEARIYEPTRPILLFETMFSLAIMVLGVERVVSWMRRNGNQLS